MSAEKRYAAGRMRVLGLCLASLTMAPPAQQLLADVNAFTDEPGSAPGPYVAFGSGVAFAASTATFGRELWLASAASASAVLVADLAPGPVDANPSYLTVAAHRLFFAAHDGTAPALYVTDGTFAGTRRLRSLAFAPNQPVPQIVAAGANVFLVAEDGTFGRELWHSDGTAVGTRLVRDLEPGPDGGVLVSAVTAGNDLYAALRTPATSPQRTLIVRSDATAAGTVVLSNTDRGGPDVEAPLVPAGGYVYFAGSLLGVRNFEPWRTDGTPSGTRQLLDLHPNGSSYVRGMIPFRGGVAYLGHVGAYGTEPIVSDGSPAGTYIADVNRLVGRGSMPMFLTEMGGDLYLFAQGTTGQGLYRIDGTTRVVSHLRTVAWQPGPRSEIVAAGNRLFFRALDPAAQGRTAAQLFVSDGTPAGTRPLRDLRAGLADPGFDHLTVAGTDAFFTLDDGLLGAEPWLSDGSSGGTRLAANVHASSTASGRGSAPAFFLAAGLRTVFDADDGERGREPWVTDGVPGDARRLLDLVPGRGGSHLAPVGATLAGALFTSSPGPSGVQRAEYWVSDGTPAGTRRLPTSSLLGAPLRGAIASDAERAVVFAAPRLTASGSQVQGFVLARSAGDAVTPLLPPFVAAPRDVHVVAGEAFFAASTPERGYEPWTTAGPVMDLWPGPASSDPGASLKASLRGVYLFSANDGVRGVELWRSDGTAAGTRLLADLAPGAASSHPRAALAAAERLFFVADVPLAGAELCVTDGTAAGTRVVIDLWPGPQGSSPRELTAQHGGVYFAADDGITGRELWWTDGTAAGTRLVADVHPGFEGSSPRAITALGSRRVLFVATDSVEGDEPWMSDGSRVGTRRLATLRAGAAGSGIAAFDVRPDGRVLFVADDGIHGREPWTLDPGAVAVRIGRSCGPRVTTLDCTDPVLGQTSDVWIRHDGGSPLAGVLMVSGRALLRGAGCALFVEPAHVAVPFALTQGSFALSVPLPDAPRLLGLVLHAQAAVGPLAIPPELSLSDAVALRLGR